MTRSPAAAVREPKFTCKGCKRRVPWSFGCDDDMPHHCDDCWANAHAEAAKERA